MEGVLYEDKADFMQQENSISRGLGAYKAKFGAPSRPRRLSPLD